MLTLLLINNCWWQCFVNFPCGHVGSHKNLGTIGSAVMAFIGYKQANYILMYIDIYLYSPWSTYIWSTKRRSALLKILDIKSISTMRRYPTRFFSLSSTFIPLDIYRYPLQTRYGWKITGLRTKGETVQNLYCVLTYIYRYPLLSRYGWKITGLRTKDETSETTVQNLYCVLTYI